MISAPKSVFGARKQVILMILKIDFYDFHIEILKKKTLDIANGAFDKHAKNKFN